MAIQPLPAHGTLNWDIPLNSILAQVGSHWYPSDQGWLGWSMDPTTAAGSNVLVLGTVQHIAIPLRQPATITSIVATVIGAGVGLTAGQCFAGIYNSAGTRVGVTADQSTAWLTTGPKTMALTAPIAAAPAGMYYVALLTNGGTSPAFARDFNDTPGTANVGLTAATFRFATGPTVQTSLPASITMSSRLTSSQTFFAALA
jgi:hypothetical protein